MLDLLNTTYQSVSDGHTNIEAFSTAYVSLCINPIILTTSQLKVVLEALAAILWEVSVLDRSVIENNKRILKVMDNLVQMGEDNKLTRIKREEFRGTHNFRVDEVVRAITRLEASDLDKRQVSLNPYVATYTIKLKPSKIPGFTFNISKPTSRGGVELLEFEIPSKFVHLEGTLHLSSLYQRNFTTVSKIYQIKVIASKYNILDNRTSLKSDVVDFTVSKVGEINEYGSTTMYETPENVQCTSTVP